jgi:hypothetical protein
MISIGDSTGLEGDAGGADGASGTGVVGSAGGAGVFFFLPRVSVLTPSAVLFPFFGGVDVVVSAGGGVVFGGVDVVDFAGVVVDFAGVVVDFAGVVVVFAGFRLGDGRLRRDDGCCRVSCFASSFCDFSNFSPQYLSKLSSYIKI